LVPDPANGEGEVHVSRHLDEWTEASNIADAVVSVHSAGGKWSDVAVLCRTSRLFQLLQRAFGERDVPVEILGLAGLLKLPEIVEVLAYARAVSDPTASVALARILMGPRYRAGFKDIALVAALATKESRRLREDLELEEDDRFLIAEALERLEEVEGLSPEGLIRLEEFRKELTELRQEARKPAAEFFAEVIRRTGLLAELDADLDRKVAQATKRNLATFLEEVHRFEPIEGELTLGKFLDYVDEAERVEKQEWAPVQPSEDDSVKVMTIHVAKGLEFDHVFVPGFALGILPNPETPQNPAERGKSLDFELRGDRDILPRYEGVLKQFKDALREQEIIEERRTAYVALTRARRTLWVSGAYWYGLDTVKPKKPSQFFDELADWGEKRGRASVERGPAEPSDENPMLELRDRFVRDWPERAFRDGEADSTFPSGWRRAALDAAREGGTQPSLVEALSPAERGEFDADADHHRQLAHHLREREAEENEAPPTPLPAVVSVAGLRLYLECPKRFYWTNVRPLPTFRGAQARIGTEVHRWIERHAAGQAVLPDLDEMPDLTVDELVGMPGKVDKLRRAFLSSRFAGLVPRHAEHPFVLAIDGFRIGGRIDAVYGGDSGLWEVVDWKTGRKPENDPLSFLQLDVYGLACVEVWRKRPEDLILTYLYLASGEEVSRPMGDHEEVRKRVVATLEAIASGGFDPTPGEQCRWCDFRPFCPEGAAWVAQKELT
jgi:DNA helicase-2/ATP-dependent DNA helicase PcrA